MPLRGQNHPKYTHRAGWGGEGGAGSLLARPTTHRPTTNLPKIHASGGPNDKPTQIHASGGRVTSRAPNDTNHPTTHIGLQWQSASIWQQFAEDAKVIAGTYADLHMSRGCVCIVLGMAASVGVGIAGVGLCICKRFRYVCVCVLVCLCVCVFELGCGCQLE